jgi:hypothetical protein
VDTIADMQAAVERQPDDWAATCALADAIREAGDDAGADWALALARHGWVPYQMAPACSYWWHREVCRYGPEKPFPYDAPAGSILPPDVFDATVAASSHPAQLPHLPTVLPAGTADRAAAWLKVGFLSLPPRRRAELAGRV